MSNFPKERSSYKSEIPIFEIPGGIHPVENKTQSNGRPISELPLADELVINLKGQAGNRSVPVVAVGDTVLKGQLIAQNDGLFSANHHAPTSGIISAIETRPIAHVSGLDDLCIVLTSDHLDTPFQSTTGIADYHSLARETLLARILDAGIVGLGGASFPSHIKLQREHGVKTLIINAAECEPYITCDDRLLQENAVQVLQGAQIVSRMYQDINIIVGIEDNKPLAIEALRVARSELQETDANFKLDIAVIPTKYPSGGEKQLIQLVTGQEVPKGKLPADLGIILHNVATCYAIYEAIILGQPLTSRIVTLTGDACTTPANYRIPFGTPIEHLIKQLSTDTRPQKLVMGGPMMGFDIQNPASGIVKATNCIIMASSDELRDEADEMPCIRCGACMDACPASLLPQQLFWHAKSDEFDKAEDYNLFDCIECGACAYVCPSDIPLVQYYRYAKSTIRNNAVEKNKSEKARERHEARLERIERVKREKAQKHKQAAEARKKAAAAAGKTDAKKAAVAAALARVQAKKAEQSEQSGKQSQEKVQDKKQTKTDGDS